MRIAGSVVRAALLSRAVTLAAVALGMLAFGAGPASAAREAHELTGTITGSGTSAFGTPYGVAVDNSGGSSAGDVYVTDPTESRVEKFDAAGNFLLMFGKEVDVTTGGDICPIAPTDVCGPGTFGSGAGGFSSPNYIAVDSAAGPSAGDIYVSDGNGIVQKFDPTGALVTSWGNGGALSAGATAGFGPIGGITVTPSGTLAVFNYYGEVFEFSPAGTPTAYYKVAGASNTGGLAADGSGHLFKDNQGYPSTTWEKVTQGTGSDVGTVDLESSGSGIAYDPAHEDLYISNAGSVQRYRFTGNDTVLEGHFPCTFKPGAGCGPTDAFGEGDLTAAVGIGVRWSTGVVYVADAGAGVDRVGIFTPVLLPEARVEPPTALTQFSLRLQGTVDSAQGPALTNCRFEYGPTSAYGSSVPCEPGGALSGEVPVGANLVGLAPETPYHYRLVAEGGGQTYRSGDKTVITGPPAMPVVESTTVAALGATGAILSSTIDPGGAPLVYRFDYGPTPAYGTRTFPGGPLQPAAGGAVTGSIALAGLTPGVTYHFRVLATNFSGTVFGPDETFTTLGGGDTAIPAPTTAVRAAPAPEPAKCKKGFALKQGKCVKSPAKKKKKHHKPKHKPAHHHKGKKR